MSLWITAIASMQLKETHMTHAEKNAFAPPRDRKDTAIVLEQLFQCFNLLQFHVHDSLYTFVMFFLSITRKHGPIQFIPLLEKHIIN